MKETIKRVSDTIKPRDVKTWGNDVITISAPCGSGKSYLVKNVLYDIARANNQKILFLIHRINCVDQFQLEIEKDKKTDVIDIKTYQSLEALKNKHNTTFDFRQYKYIVCDEFHYFLSDATFNKTTDISLKMILEQTDKTRIFMSATTNDISRYINNIVKVETIDYKIPILFNHINELRFFNTDETMEIYIKDVIKTNDKMIFFIQSATKAYELYIKYKSYCLFNCGKGDEHYRYVDIDKIENMLMNERFEEQILITTTCLDAGVNLIDTDLKHIIIDVQDISVLQQCLGRKRIQSPEDKVYLYIKAINNKQLGGKTTQLHKKIEMADYLKKHNTQKYVLKYGRDNDPYNIVYDEVLKDIDKSTKKINELMYFKCKFDLGTISIMLSKYKGNYGYCKYLSELFGMEYSLEEEEYGQGRLEKYLESIVGKPMLQVRDRKELIEKIDVKSNGKLLKNISTLNIALEEQNIPYKIIEFSTSKMIDGKQKRYTKAWKVKKIN